MVGGKRKGNYSNYFIISKRKGKNEKNIVIHVYTCIHAKKYIHHI